MRNRCKKLLAFVLAAVCCAGTFSLREHLHPEAVSTIEELEAQREANNKKIAAYEKKLAKYEADQKQEAAYQAALTEKINALQENMQILDTELNALRQTIAQADAEITAMEQTIAGQEVRIQEGMEVFKLRLRAMYINGSDSLASALVGATDFYDLLSRYKLISCVAQHDDALVTGLRNELTDYHQSLADLEERHEQLSLAQSEQETRQQEMQDSMAELQRAYADSEAEQQRLAAEFANTSQSIASLQEKNALAEQAETEMQEQIRIAAEQARRAAAEKAAAEARAEAEAAKAQAEAAAKAQAEAEAQARAQAEADAQAKAEAQAKAQAETVPPEAPAQTVQQPEPVQPASDTIAFSWPCPGHYYISSGFGARWGTQHKGIDIAQNEGAAVTAAHAGTVIQTYTDCTHNYGKDENCCGNGYGNYVLLLHDDGTFSTMYGHMQSVTVAVGDHVEMGTTLGYVGTTGWSTGYHLHFEIRRDGVAVDPADYLLY